MAVYTGLLSSGLQTDPWGPIGATVALHGVKEQMFRYPEEASAAASAHTGYSSSHFSTTVPLGTKASKDWAAQKKM